MAAEAGDRLAMRKAGHCHASGCGHLKMHIYNKVNISIFVNAEQMYNALAFILFLRLCLKARSDSLGDTKSDYSTNQRDWLGA